MRFMDKKFDISTMNDYYGKFVVSLFKIKRTVSKEIRVFNKVLNSSKILDIELEVFDVIRAAIIILFIYFFIYSSRR